MTTPALYSVRRSAAYALFSGTSGIDFTSFLAVNHSAGRAFLKMTATSLRVAARS